MAPTTPQLHEDVLELKARLDMHDVLLRGNGEYQGAISDLRAITSMVQEMRAADAARVKDANEAKKQVAFMLFGSALSAVTAAGGAVVAWIVGHR